MSHILTGLIFLRMPVSSRRLERLIKVSDVMKSVSDTSPGIDL